MDDTCRNLEKIIEVANAQIGWRFGGAFSVRQSFWQGLKGNYDIVYKNGKDNEKVFPVTKDERVGGDVLCKEFQTLYDYIREEGYKFTFRL